MRKRHVELCARGMEHWQCGDTLSATEHFKRAEYLSSDICRLRQKIRRVERMEAEWPA
jgi:hypothetical protein